MFKCCGINMIFVEKLFFAWLILRHTGASSSDLGVTETPVIPDDIECEQIEVNSSNTVFVWPKVQKFGESYSHSTPVCLDELKFPKYRYYNENCMNQTSLSCAFAQKNFEMSSICPNGEPAFVDEYSKICFSNSTRVSRIWDYAPCMRYGLNIDLLDMEAAKRAPLLKFLAQNYGEKFWLPLRREQSYQPAQYYVPVMWKMYKTFDWLSIFGFNGDCVSMEIVNTSFLLKYDNCNNHYPILCGYNQTDFRRVQYNGSSYLMNTFPNLNKYFYVHPNQCPHGNISVADSTEKTRMYQQLLNSDSSECNISVFSGNSSSASPNTKQYSSTTPCGTNCALGITDWVKRFNDIAFVNWKADDIGSGAAIVVDSTGGWKLNQRPMCTICEDVINQFNITDFFLYSNNDDEMVLVIKAVVAITEPDNNKSNMDNIFNLKDMLGINCFAQYTNMKFENLDTIKMFERQVNSFPIGLFIYKELYGGKIEKSGRFWCEGYSIIHNRVLLTNEIYIELGDYTETYAVLTKVRGIATEVDQARIQYHANFLYQLVSSRLELYSNSVRSVNFKTIISINYLIQEMFAVIHFKLTLPGDQYEYGNRLIFFKNELWKTLEFINGTTYTFYGLNHTRFCLPETVTIGGTVLQWNIGRGNELVTTKNFDLDENGVPIVRFCYGDFDYGSQWIIWNEMNVLNLLAANSWSKELFYLESVLANNTEMSVNILKNVSSIMKMNQDDLISADLFTVGKVLSHLTNSDFTQIVESESMDSITEVTGIMDVCIQINEEMAQNLLTLNTTNTILYSFEKILCNMLETLHVDEVELQVAASNLLVFVLNPTLNNISGLAVYKNLSKAQFDNDFSDYYIDYIYANSTPVFAEGFTIASHIPDDLLGRLLQIIDDLQIIITLYYNDVLYQDEENGDEVDSIVISVTIPDTPSRLSGLLQFYFTSKSNSYYSLTSNSSLFESNYCSYWNFQPKNETKNSEWSQEGCYFMGFEMTVDNKTQISICGCRHLTSFAFLIGDLDVTRISEIIVVPSFHDDALDLITLMGCTLSIFGVIGIFITAIVFPTFRRKSGVKILLQLSTAIALQMLLMVFVTTRLINFEVTDDTAWICCLLYGAALHYSVLAVFAWMLISAYLQFNRYVRVFKTKTKNLILISSIIGWIVPLVPVLVAVLVASDSYRAAVTSSLNVCYPTGYTLILAVILPVTLIIIANLTIFVLVMYNIFKMASNKIHAKEKDIVMSQLRLSVFLFFLLGLSWIFGLANTLNFGVTFSYLFCLTASMQGMVLFIYFVIMDPETRHLWCNSLKLMSFQDKKF